jgi:two-component system OmpR family response regulator
MSICRQTTEDAALPAVWAQRASILVVDDDAVVLDMVGSFLREEGFEVATAENGREAFDRLRAGRPDLIVLDLLMPVEDGWQTLEKLRSHPIAATVPVILLSASQQLNEQARRLRVDDFLPKPFDMQELLDKVNKLALPC